MQGSEASSAPAPAPDRVRQLPTRQTRKRKRRARRNDDDDDDLEDDGVYGVDHDGDEVYEVDEVVDKRGDGDNVEYLVYWKPRSRWPDATWVHASNFQNAPDVVNDYETRLLGH